MRRARLFLDTQGFDTNFIVVNLLFVDMGGMLSMVSCALLAAAVLAFFFLIRRYFKPGHVNPDSPGPCATYN